MAEMRVVEVDVGPLAVLEAGRGGRPLLLVHGWTGAKEDFEDWIDPLAAVGWHVVAPDLRGHGSSAKPSDEQAYRLDSFVDDLLDLAAELEWPRFSLLGHSMGGMVAQLLAIGHADRLDALVLMDTHHAGVDIAPELVEAGIQAAREVGTEAIAALMEASDEPGPLDTPASLRLARERPGYRQRGIDNTRRASAAMFAATLPQITGSQSRLELLRTVAVPTLVMVGALDEPFLEGSCALAEAVPGAGLAVLPDAGHSPQFEAPEAWWKALTAFLDQVPVASRGAASPPS